MLKLRSLEMADERSFRAAIAEFKSVDPEWVFAFDFDEKTNFADYVKLLQQWSKGKDLPSNFVPSTFLVASVGNAIVGRVSIRHVLNDFLLQFGGHVGYGVVPSHRRKGYATEILRQTLPIAKNLEIDRLLVTCDDNNIGSLRTIEANGGVLENKIVDPSSKVLKRRYWIEL